MAAACPVVLRKRRRVIAMDRTLSIEFMHVVTVIRRSFKCRTISPDCRKDFCNLLKFVCNQ